MDGSRPWGGGLAGRQPERYVSGHDGRAQLSASGRGHYCVCMIGGLVTYAIIVYRAVLLCADADADADAIECTFFRGRGEGVGWFKAKFTHLFCRSVEGPFETVKGV